MDIPEEFTVTAGHYRVKLSGFYFHLSGPPGESEWVALARTFNVCDSKTGKEASFEPFNLSWTGALSISFLEHINCRLGASQYAKRYEPGTALQIPMKLKYTLRHELEKKSQPYLDEKDRRNRELFSERLGRAMCYESVCPCQR